MARRTKYPFWRFSPCPFHIRLVRLSLYAAPLFEPDFPKTLLLDTNVLIDVATGEFIKVPDETSVFVSSLSLVELAAPNYMDVTVAEAILNAN